MSELPEKIPLIILEFSESPSLFVTHHTRYMVELPSFPSFEWDLLVIDTPKGEDLILGFEFLNNFNPSIDWRKGLITFNADHKDYYDHSKSFSNDFYSTKSCAALVGDSRTPSFPSSVHIPSLHSHQSLLSSKDEVVKEIQDVGEDNSVKAEKIPPHHNCDHHIELEGSLPPEEALRQLNQLKEVFPIAPILSHFDPFLPTILETDASDYALGAVLSQISDSGKHPIAFDSRKLLLAELNYEINDKELLGIVWALKHWRAFLLSLSSSFEVLTNHSSLQYFMSSKILTCCQAHWAEFLSEFHFSITYHPGCLATLPDALSRRDNIYPERGEDFIRKNPMNYQKIIKQDEIQASKFFAVKVEAFSNLIESIQKELWQDSQYRSILQDLGKGKSVQDYSLDSSSQLLLFKDQVVVPNDPTIKLSILQKRHEPPLAGHPGQEKTLKLVKWDFHWPGMTQFIKDYVSSCQQCSRNKNIHHKKFGLLKPLQIPNGPWICLSMDFITQLPLSNSLESILSIVNRFSKMAVLIPTMSSITSSDFAYLLIKNIFSKHGFPSSIVSDRGSLFVSSFWTNLCQKLKISRDLSTAYHPETDGQTERAHQIIEQYLWIDPHFDSAHITQATPAGKLSTKIQSVQQDVKRELEVAISRFKRYADKNRASPPVFNPVDMVWLSSKNIKSTRPTKELSERWLGPFTILKKVSTHAYHLNGSPSTQSSIFNS
ncbi:hypothetical protein O181_066318 [Austropuccinia psidii MF-1]|uniref:Integrase catalytic domain-containing protein n=1 Tax=Austropuccinia psidii MF-1 TaxID=1389203 RepID=A0A9Q3EWY1_9BASI|nr:hypothetical protein [Austropuccinia psidii MF-1]